MTALLLSFLAGVVAHKGWRVAWSIRRGRPVRRAVRAEFAPPDERKKPEPQRARRVTEVA